MDKHFPPIKFCRTTTPSLMELLGLFLCLDDNNRSLNHEVRDELFQVKDSLKGVVDEVSKNSTAIKELRTIYTPLEHISHTTLLSELTNEVEKINMELNEIQKYLDLTPLDDITSMGKPKTTKDDIKKSDDAKVSMSGEPIDCLTMVVPSTPAPRLPLCNLDEGNDVMNIGSVLLDFVVTEAEQCRTAAQLTEILEEKRVVV